MSSRLPVIGIVSYGRVSNPERYALPVDYVSAVRRSGGRAVLIPPGQDPAGEILDGVAGLVLAGGGDVDPSLYGEDRHPKVYGVDAERDALELALVRAAIDRRVPTLAICRGLQVVNVALGGDLVQHLPDRVSGRVPHRVGAGEWAFHPVRLAAGSQLASVCGVPCPEVASSHHQAPNRLGAGLEAVAWAEDQTVEGLELEGHPELLAVQWHPEETAGRDPTQQRLFDWLVQRSRDTAG